MSSVLLPEARDPTKYTNASPRPSGFGNRKYVDVQTLLLQIHVPQHAALRTWFFSIGVALLDKLRPDAAGRPNCRHL